MSLREHTKDRIRRILIRDLQLNLREDELKHVTKLDELFGMDSVAVIELIIGLEKEFIIRIPPQCLDFEIFRDLDALADLVNRLVSVEKKNGLSS